MAGVALGRLWDTNPKIAFVLHLLVCVAVGLVLLSLIVARLSLPTVVVVGILFLVEVIAFVPSTIDAAQRGWTRS